MACGLLAGLLAAGLLHPAPAARSPQKNFLPPVATINTHLQADAPAGGTATETGDAIEPVTLSAVTSPTTVRTSPSPLRLDNDLGIKRSSSEYQALLDLQRTLDDADLKGLWDATVDRNPVIRFSLEKLATPQDLHPAKSSIFMRKTLSLLISGAAMGATMLPGGGTYRNMGSMAAGDALRNVVNGPPPELLLTPTEQIQLANLVDELQARLIQAYHDYKNTLQALAIAHQATVRDNNLYSRALASKNDLAIMAAGTAYFKALLHETTLRNQARLHRIELERLAGAEAVGALRLSLAITPDLLEAAAPKPEHAKAPVRKSGMNTPASEERLQDALK